MLPEIKYTSSSLNANTPPVGAFPPICWICGPNVEYHPLLKCRYRYDSSYLKRFVEELKGERNENKAFMVNEMIRMAKLREKLNRFGINNLV